jgi:hypothetical protein
MELKGVGPPDMAVIRRRWAASSWFVPAAAWLRALDPGRGATAGRPAAAMK